MRPFSWMLGDGRHDKSTTGKNKNEMRRDRERERQTEYDFSEIQE